MSLKVKFKFMEEELFRTFIFTDIQTFNNYLERALSDVSCLIRCFVLYWYCFVNRIWWYSIWWLNCYCRGNTGIVLSNWNGPVGSSCSVMAQGDANIWWAGFSEYGRCFIWNNGKTSYTLGKNRVTCKKNACIFIFKRQQQPRWRRQRQRQTQQKRQQPRMDYQRNSSSIFKGTTTIYYTTNDFNKNRHNDNQQLQ